VNLRVARVGEQGAFLGGAPSSGDVAAHRVGRQVEDVSVSAGGQDDRIGCVGFDFSRHQIPRHDSAGVPIDGDQVEHVVAREHFDVARGNLGRVSRVRPNQELLAGLAACVEGPADEGPAEGPVSEQSAVFPCERNALGCGLVDDVHAEFSESVHVRFAGPEVAAFDRIVEEAVDRVSVILVVLRGVDSTLSRDRVRSARRVLEAEVEDVVAQLTQSRGGGRSGEAGAHNNDGVLSLVRRIDDLDVELVARPRGLDWSRRCV
jgi:hypothetical protein